MKSIKKLTHDDDEDKDQLNELPFVCVFIILFYYCGYDMMWISPDHSGHSRLVSAAGAGAGECTVHVCVRFHVMHGFNDQHKGLHCME